MFHCCLGVVGFIWLYVYWVCKLSLMMINVGTLISVGIFKNQKLSLW